MKGPRCDPEVAEAVKSRGDFFRLVANHAYTIPGTTQTGGWLSLSSRKESRGPRLGP